MKCAADASSSEKDAVTINSILVRFISAAKGFGCTAVHAKTTKEIKVAFAAALEADGPTLIAIPIARQERPLVPPVD